MSDCSLYLISPPKIVLKEFAKQLTEALSEGGVTSFQLRLKDVTDQEILVAAEILQPICARHGVAFILNDRPDLVEIAQADGVHLGQEDLAEWPIDQVRELIGQNRIIGVSAHASRHLAMEAGENDADYVAFGAFYPTTSKSMEKLAKWGTPEPAILEWWSTHTVLPCVAIGGITPANCKPLVQAGADFLAVINAVWSHSEGPGAAVHAFNKAMTHDD